MSSTEIAGIELISEIFDKFRKSYEEMISHRESLPKSKSLFEDIKQHLFNIQRSLEQKMDELETKERAFEEKKVEHRTLLEEREAAVTAKEQTLWDRLQELKDAAVSSIMEARKKNMASPVLENQVSTSANDVLLHEPFLAPEEKISVNKLSHSAEAMAGEVEPRPKLKQLCKQMNVKGLLKFFSDHRKSITSLRDELPFALRSANEPAHFVLKILEGFYPKNQSNFSPNLKENKNLLVLRSTCLLLMESVASLLTMAEPGDDLLLSSEIKKQAKVIADEWKLKLAEVPLETSNGHSLEAQTFLQLLATFSISSEFDEDELCKLVITMSRRRRRAPELCRAVGLEHKSQDVVEALIAKGRLIDALHFAYFFQLTEVFPLVPLLKQYLKKTEETIARSIAAGLKKEAANQELSALKTAIRCIEEYKLQEEYPPVDLQDRIKRIEKTKISTKRTADAAKFPAKRHRANDRHPSRNTPISVENRFTPPTIYDSRRREMSPYSAPRLPYEPSYNYLPPYQHEVKPYQYPDERIPPYSSSTNYGGYYGIQSTSYNYGNYMGSSSHQSYI